MLLWEKGRHSNKSILPTFKNITANIAGQIPFWKWDRSVPHFASQMQLEPRLKF